MLVPSTVWAQRDSVKTAPAKDTIFLTTGRKVACDVRSISGQRILYKDSTGAQKSFQRKNIHKILYANGKATVFNDVAIQEAEEGDWRLIILTEDPAQVEGLYPRGAVYGQSSPTNRTVKSAQNSAETRIKKRAAAKKGLVVLISKRQRTGGYGEVPTIRLEGEVYGTEPLPDGEDPNAPVTDSADSDE